MSYMNIDNLYKATDILLFRECYAMEKIHGTSAHITFKNGQINFFSGGCKHDAFIMLFDSETLLAKYNEKAIPAERSATIYGEAYGGSLMKMRDTYGDKLRFVAFEVKIGDSWLAVPQAEEFARSLGLDFVHYVKVATDLSSLDAQRDAQSFQAVKNGMGEGKPREGIVLRPLIEVTKNNGERIIAKHKADKFKETATPHKVGENLKVISDAKAIAQEWVTLERLRHVLDNFPQPYTIEITGKVLIAMNADIAREAKGEIAMTTEALKEINRATALMYKDFLKKEISNV
jgi:hypothetical protein